ncbi:MAG: MAPEG family protein [Gammaproteobacteria bacterium]|nr:MAPEG family protein [Gammaproteobacteria bacterium]
MNTSLSNEVFWLILTIFMTSLFWIPYIINRMSELGILNALWDRYGRTDTTKKWAIRMMQAHDNAIENLVLFAPLVILVEITGANSGTTATACMIYFFTRLIHFTVFTFAGPLLRVVSFLVGFWVQVVLALTLLGV